MSRFKLPPPIIDIYVEKSLYRDKPKETVFHISPRPQTDLIENRLKQIKRLESYAEIRYKNFLY